MLLATSALGQQHAERRVALVIGNGGYEHVATLPNPRNDADDISALLTELDFEVVGGRDLTIEGMRDAVRTFARALEGADVALFYYAGHAVQVNGRNYLIPVDAVLEDDRDLDFDALALGFVQQQMEREGARILIFLDACRDNPFASSLASASRSVGPGRGLAREAVRGRGTFIAFATEPDAVALDGTGRNSPFTGALLNNLGRKGIEISALMTDVRREVYEATDHKQLPWANSSLLDHFYFREGQPEPEPTPVVAPLPREATPAEMVARADTALAQRSYAVAASLYRSAAETGSARAMTAFGKLLAGGVGVAEDPAAAHAWYEKAAALDDAEGQFLLGRDFERGEGGVAPDLQVAIGWYRKAVERGNAEAMNNLAVMYSLGEGVAEDDAEALALFQRSAEAGSGNGMFNFAAMHDTPGSPAYSPDTAAHWMAESIKAGNANALLEMRDNHEAWSPDFKKALQRLLREEGLYSGAVDGILGSGTLSALETLASKGG